MLSHCLSILSDQSNHYILCHPAIQICPNFNGKVQRFFVQLHFSLSYTILFGNDDLRQPRLCSRIGSYYSNQSTVRPCSWRIDSLEKTIGFCSILGRHLHHIAFFDQVFVLHWGFIDIDDKVVQTTSNDLEDPLQPLEGQRSLKCRARLKKKRRLSETKKGFRKHLVFIELSI